MLIIKVWCLPKLEEEKLQELHKGLVAAAVAVEEFGVHDEHDMVNLFPPDMMSYGLGSEIIVEAMEVAHLPFAPPHAYYRLGRELEGAVRGMFPSAIVHVIVNQGTPMHTRTKSPKLT
jgi:hypothetical protein